MATLTQLERHTIMSAASRLLLRHKQIPKFPLDPLDLYCKAFVDSEIDLSKIMLSLSDDYFCSGSTPTNSREALLHNLSCVVSFNSDVTLLLNRNGHEMSVEVMLDKGVPSNHNNLVVMIDSQDDWDKLNAWYTTASETDCNIAHANYVIRKFINLRSTKEIMYATWPELFKLTMPEYTCRGKAKARNMGGLRKDIKEVTEMLTAACMLEEKDIQVWI